MMSPKWYFLFTFCDANCAHILLGYVSDINLLCENINTTQKNTQALLDSSKEQNVGGVNFC